MWYHQVRRGFSLVELLVCVAVIAILAGLILGPLAKAKARAKSARCKSNLRQYGIALQMYLADFQKYPLYGRVIQGEPTETYWFDLLQPYTSVRWAEFKDRSRPNQLYFCPAYEGAVKPSKRSGLAITLPDGSYGFNAYGTGPEGSDLGIGGFDGAFFPGRNRGYEAIAETKVFAPMDMIFLGDSHEMKWPDDPQGLYTWGFPYLGTREPDVSPFVFQPGRHSGAHNVLFCDGHVESIPQTKLFEAADIPRRRFNVDNEPHRETW